VVHLGEQRDAAITEAVDHVQLPQGVRAVERSRDEARDLVAELAVVARRGKRELPNMELEVECSVLDPVRVIDAERDGSQAPAKRWQQVDALDAGVLTTPASSLPPGADRGS
jgi:hypothetical protein